MQLNSKAKDLLEKLRAAIVEALGDSSDVPAAMAELVDAGFHPSFGFDITLQEEVEPSSIKLVTRDEGLILTASDESFLRTLGIVNCSRRTELPHCGVIR